MKDHALELWAELGLLTHVGSGLSLVRLILDVLKHYGVTGIHYPSDEEEADQYRAMMVSPRNLVLGTC